MESIRKWTKNNKWRIIIVLIVAIICAILFPLLNHYGVLPARQKGGPGSPGTEDPGDSGDPGSPGGTDDSEDEDPSPYDSDESMDEDTLPTLDPNIAYNTYFCRNPPTGDEIPFIGKSINGTLLGPECNIKGKSRESVYYYASFLRETGIMIIDHDKFDYHGPIVFSLSDKLDLTYVKDPHSGYSAKTLVYYLECPGSTTMEELAGFMYNKFREFDTMDIKSPDSVYLVDPEKAKLTASEIPIMEYYFTAGTRNDRLSKYLGSCTDHEDGKLCTVADSYCEKPPDGKGPQMVGPYCDVLYDSIHLKDKADKRSYGAGFLNDSGIMVITKEGSAKSSFNIHVSHSDEFKMDLVSNGRIDLHIPPDYTIKQLADAMYLSSKDVIYGNPPMEITVYTLNDKFDDVNARSKIKDKIHYSPTLPNYSVRGNPQLFEYVNSDYFGDCVQDESGVKCSYVNREYLGYPQYAPGYNNILSDFQL